MTRARPRPAIDEATQFSAMMGALRTFLDGVTAAAPEPELVARITAALHGFTRELEPRTVSIDDQIAGQLHDLPGRAQALVPPLQLEEIGDGALASTVVFGRYYQGRGPAVHGGAIPLLFDELLGMLVERDGRPAARTAYLKVDYRAITPPDTELRIEGRLDRVEGRKRFAIGTLHAGDTLCAEAHALYVELRPGQL
jgi:acyl-coenzyme A thioesterase PaaI-like protein